MILHTEVIKNNLFTFELYNEEDIDWPLQNTIHEALNKAYSFRTRAFTQKTYAYRIPKRRILCWHENKLVGPRAIFEDYITINGDKFLIGGIGLTLSLRPHSLLGFHLRQCALSLFTDAQYAFVIGRVKNNARTKKYLLPIVETFLDIPLIGQHTRSHDWETLAIYPLNVDKEKIGGLICHFQQMGYIQIEGEIF